MLQLEGKYNTAKVYADNIDNSTISQIISILNIESFKDSTIRFMPDCHAGKGCTVGTTMTIHDKVVPNIVGIDIGCGVLAIKLKETRIDLPSLDSIIKKYVPSGASANKQAKVVNNELDDLLFRKYNGKYRGELANASLGTLGGGNHFIEIDRDEQSGELWLLIHTGSRHLGIEVCDFYQKVAYLELKIEANGGSREEHRKKFIEEIKKTKGVKEINKELKRFDKEYREVEPSVPYELAYLTGEWLDRYIHDMRITQRHAALNRSTIAKTILKNAKLHEVDRIDTIHNYIDTDNMIIRKGAVSAQVGERLVIPINMRDGTLLCTGKGNPDWNFSAPHGAGRLYSRSETKSRVSMSEYKEAMKEAGVYSTSISTGTLDECPMAYRDIKTILSSVTETVEINSILRPIYNFKAGKED